MTIRFACECGQQLAAADEHAGKRVKCGACGGIQTVPASARPRPAVAAPKASANGANGANGSAPLRFECACGQACRAKPEHAGKKIKCPKCGKLLTIPSPDDAEEPEWLEEEPRPRKSASVTAAKSAARSGQQNPFAFDEEEEERPRRRRRDEDEDFEDEQDRSRKRKKGGSKKKWIFIGAGVAAVAGVALLLFLLLGGGSISSDFDLVPRDAQGFVTIRVADLLKTPVGKKLLDKAGDQKEQLEEAEKTFGLSLQDVERVTVVFLDVEKNSLYFIVQTSKAVDKNKILKVVDNTSEKKHEGKTYHVANGRAGAVYFASDKLTVFGTETNIKKVIEGKKKSGPLEDALKLASRSKYQIAGGFNIPSSLLDKFKRGAGPEAAQFGDAFTVKSASLAVAVGDDVEIDLAAYFPDSGKAKSALEAVKAGLTFAKMANEALKKIPDPKQSGKAVELTWKLGKGEVDSLIELGGDQMLSGLGGFGGGGRRVKVGGRTPPGQGGRKLTAQNIARVAKGMTLPQVEAILGPGEQLENSGVYLWGEGALSLTITFTNGRVSKIESFRAPPKRPRPGR